MPASVNIPILLIKKLRPRDTHLAHRLMVNEQQGPDLCEPNLFFLLSLFNHMLPLDSNAILFIMSIQLLWGVPPLPDQ